MNASAPDAAPVAPRCSGTDPAAAATALDTLTRDRLLDVLEAVPQSYWPPRPDTAGQGGTESPASSRPFSPGTPRESHRRSSRQPACTTGKTKCGTRTAGSSVARAAEQRARSTASIAATSGLSGPIADHRSGPRACRRGTRKRRKASLVRSGPERTSAPGPQHPAQGTRGMPSTKPRRQRAKRRQVKPAPVRSFDNRPKAEEIADTLFAPIIYADHSGPQANAAGRSRPLQVSSPARAPGDGSARTARSFEPLPYRLPVLRHREHAHALQARDGFTRAARSSEVSLVPPPPYQPHDFSITGIAPNRKA